MSDTIAPPTPTVASITAAATANPTPAPTDYNGFNVTVDLAKPVDYIGDVAKIVVTQVSGDDHFNLRDTLTHRLWVIQGKPTTATPVTQDHIGKIVDWVRMDVARTGIYRVATAAGIAVTFRSSDVTTLAAIPAAARQSAIVDAMVDHVNNDPSQKSGLGLAGKNCLLCIEANAIHREQMDGHNWYTADTSNRKTPTGKACTIAGAHTPEFREFMREYGHDSFHHLSTPTLSNIALAVAGGGAAAVNERNVMWDGIDIDGEALSKVFYTGEAAVQRYPAGILGKAAIVVSCAMARGMIHNITTKLSVKGATPVNTVISGVAAAVSKSDFTHESLISIGRALDQTVAVVYGYSLTARLVDEGEYLAFENHAKRNPAGIAMGKTLAQAVLSAIPNASAVETAVATAIADVGQTFSSVAGINVGTAAAPILVATDVAAIAIDVAGIEVKAGEDKSAKFMDALIAGKIGGVAGASGKAPAPATP